MHGSFRDSGFLSAFVVHFLSVARMRAFCDDSAKLETWFLAVRIYWIELHVYGSVGKRTQRYLHFITVKLT